LAWLGVDVWVGAWANDVQRAVKEANPKWQGSLIQALPFKGLSEFGRPFGAVSV